jgi:cation diffusion facilitator family transporter
MSESAEIQRRRVRLTEELVRNTLLGVLFNAILAAVKGIAGVLGHSQALLADAVESMLDVFMSIVVLGGIKIASAAPDADHPYGHGKAEPLAAMVVGVGILGAALTIAVQSLRAVFGSSPQEAPAPYTLLVLIAVVVIKEFLYRRLLRLGRRANSTAVQSEAWHHRSDALTSLAAFFGILVALFGGPGFERADAIAALLSCVVIAFNGIRLLVPALNEVMDAAPHPAVEEEVRRVAASVEGVDGLETCLVRKMGIDYYVDLHIEVNGDRTVREGHDIAHRVKDSILHEVPHVRDVLIHVEPTGESPKYQSTVKESEGMPSTRT